MLTATNEFYGSGNAAGAGDAGPHAVVSAGGHSYAYDDNGNMVSGAGRTLTWTGFNKPASVVDASTTTRFAHGPDRARIVQTRTQGATTTMIVYVAGLFERVAKTGEATKSVHYIFAGGTRIAIRTTDDAPAPTDKLRYLHRDHLGSVDTITDAAGAVVERLSYGAFGKRRVATGASAWTDPALAISAVNTPRGFTGQSLSVCIAAARAPPLQPASSWASTVVAATQFGPVGAERTPGRDVGRDRGGKSGLTVESIN